MSRFNVQSQGTRIINRAGGDAYEQSAKMKILSILFTSFLKDQYYRSSQQTMEELLSLIEKDPLFSAKAAIFARNKYGMRSITHVVAAKIASDIKNKRWTKNFFYNVVHRVDDITEIFSLYMELYGKPIPNSLKKGLAKAFDKFDEYQLAKYRSEKKKYSLVDVINLVHPKPIESNKEALKKLIKNELKSTETWESKLTAAGEQENVGLAKQKAWEELINSRKIGYFALLRNLSNILNQAPDLVGKACELLTDENLIKKSLVLPFRFQTAIDKLMENSDSRQFLIALNKAIDISCSNVPRFNGKTCVVLDESGSMMGDPIKIGSLFAAILLKSNDADLIMFSDDAKYKTINPTDSTLTIQREITRDLTPSGTNFIAPFKIMNKPYKRIIILSDMQGWVKDWSGENLPRNAFIEYKKRHSCEPYIYSWDLTGYGDMQFPERNVFLLAGFSDKVFDIMKILESDRNALIKEIESINL